MWRTFKVLDQNDEFAELAMCAVRYALGRATYVSYSVPHAILNNVDRIKTNFLKVMIRDVKEFKRTHGKIGMQIDEASWLQFAEDLKAEIKRREELGAREATRKQD